MTRASNILPLCFALATGAPGFLAANGDSGAIVESQLAPRSGPRGATMFKEMEAAATGTNCATAACTPAQAAAYDLSEWYMHALNTQPEAPDGTDPQVSIVYTPGAAATDPATFLVTAGWIEPGSIDVLTSSIEVVQLGGVL
jgi:hypothetical protein